MEAKEVHNKDMFDLEKGECSLTREKNNRMDVNSGFGHGMTMQDGSWNDVVSQKDDRNHHVSCCTSHCRDSIAKNGEYRPSEGKKVGVSDNSVGDKEKKKRFKKPPRPPRPPTTSLLDPADQKLISELTELAVLKRTRMERKSLKTKNSKSSSSFGNLIALIITVILCLLIFWHGIPIGNL